MSDRIDDPQEGPSTPDDQEDGDMSLDEPSRQLELAIHDARVAFDCIELEDVERAHVNAITARAALDAAETALRHALEEQKEQKEQDQKAKKEKKASVASDD